MPLSDHAANEELRGSDKHGSVHPTGQGRASKGGPSKQVKTEGRRRGIPLDVNDASSSLLAPILSHLPSLSGIQSIKGLLPTSPSKSAPIAREENPIHASWEVADLRDGAGRSRLLLLSTPEYALQIFRLAKSSLPDDLHVKEELLAPEEVFSLPCIKHDSSTERISLIPGELISSPRRHVTQARLLTTGNLCQIHGPIVVLLASSPARNSPMSTLSLSLVPLRTGIAIKEMTICQAHAGSFAISSSAIVIATSLPSPSLHILHPLTLDPLRPPLSSLSLSADRSLPIYALSGRLLAFTVPSPPARPGAAGLGSVITADSTSTLLPNVTSGSLTSPSKSRSGTDGSQGAIISSAVEIGGGVARGVWAGLKMGARAANQARTNRVARSAPADSGTLADDEDGTESTATESRSLGESSVLEEPLPSTSGVSGGEWIKIIDLGRRSTLDAGPIVDLQVIAHFRLPAARSVTPIATDIEANRSSHSHRAPREVSCLSFNTLGTQLLASPADGRVSHVFEIHPAGPGLTSSRSDVSGQVWHLYELRRGNTIGRVCDVSWSKDGRWVSVGTGKGTIHVYPIIPTGGSPSTASHLSAKNTNPQQLYPLSSIVTAAARLRPPRTEHQPLASSTSDTVSIPEGPGIASIGEIRADPLHCDQFCQDIAIFRPTKQTVELSRLILRKAAPPMPQVVPGQRRASALTEMMRSKAGLGGEGTDLSVEKLIKARWYLPLGVNAHDVTVTVDPVSHIPLDKGFDQPLARAEIQTHCLNPRILPASIYLWRQVDFFSARPIDEFSPLSIMDVEARMKRLVFRPEVEARPISPEARSFDEPLLSALHSMIESPSSSLIPGLPNGYPASPRWKSIPIRQVAAGLGEGVDRVRREYVRAQHSRAKRRASHAPQIGLSFEDETVFANMALNDDGEASSPSSAMLPATNTESSADGSVPGEMAEDDDWGEGWEAEYAKAVEDDGGPEELVLGLMDEEEEERRKWAMKQKHKYK